MYISANQRFLICVIANAIQNAVMYSPKDTVPRIELFKISDFDSPQVGIKVINDDICFSKGNLREDANFRAQRIGFGIPIIRRFAEMYGGSFSMTEENGKVILLVTIPAYTVAGDGTQNESSEYFRFDSGVPDIVDEKLNEVLKLYGVPDESENL